MRPTDFIAQLAQKHRVVDRARPTLVFLHDSLGCIELWRDFPEKLAERTQTNLLVYDRQGYGKSCGFSSPHRPIDYLEQEANVLQALLQHHQITQAVLFGHSDGGSIALIAAALYPENIVGLITEGAHVLVEDITLDGIRAAVQAYQTTDLKKRLEKYHQANTESLFYAWTDTWTAEAFRRWNIEHFLPKIKCPALVLQGAQDEFGTLDQVARILEGIRQAQAAIIPDCGHSPHKEKPQETLAQTAAFVAQITAEKTE